MDIFKKHAPAEREAAIKEARDDFDAVDPELQYMIASSDNDFLAKVGEAIELQQETFVEPRQLTKAERDGLDSELLIEQMYGFRLDKATGIEAFDRLDKQERDAFLKTLEPVHSQNTLSGMITKAVREQLAKASSPSIQRETIPVRSQPERQILVKLADRAEEEDADSLLAKWLRGYVDGDQQAMRRVVRELLADAA